MSTPPDVAALQQQAKIQQEIETAITRIFATEDDGLRQALVATRNAGLPEWQISPIQGKLLQLLAVACNAHKILEVGSLAGYSGIWLARGLRPGGHMITLEIDPIMVGEGIAPSTTISEPYVIVSHHTALQSHGHL